MRNSTSSQVPAELYTGFHPSPVNRLQMGWLILRLSKLGVHLKTRLSLRLSAQRRIKEKKTRLLTLLL